MSPFQKNVEIACGGAIGLGCVAENFSYAVKNFPPPVLLGFAGFALGALVLLVIGVRRARGPRDAGMALGSIACPAFFGTLLWAIVPEAFHDDALVRLFIVPFPVGFAVRTWLALRGLPDNAQAVAHKATAVALRDMTPATALHGVTPITREDQASASSSSPSSTWPGRCGFGETSGGVPPILHR
jgi:hypothetical protein